MGRYVLEMQLKEIRQRYRFANGRRLVRSKLRVILMGQPALGQLFQGMLVVEGMTEAS